MIPFSIEFQPGIPFYEQVVFAVKKAVVLGQLQPGDPFPSVRELSKALLINPNTVQKAVTALVNEKILEVQSGIGTRVAQQSRGTAEQRAQILKTEVDRLVIEAQRLSITKEELLKSIDAHWHSKAKG